MGGGISGVENSDEPGWDVHIGGTLPVVRDQVGLRVSYSRNEIPGFIDNVINGEESINHGSQQAALVALLWQPNENVRLRLTALGQKIDSDNNGYAALDPKTKQPLFGDLTNQVFLDEPFTSKIGLIAATLDWNLGWATFTSATGYSNFKTDSRIDVTPSLGELPLLFGFTETGISGFELNVNLDKFSQEIRLTSRRDGRFLWQLGAFYTYERGNQTQFLFLNQKDGTPCPGLPELFFAGLPATYQEGAVFGNASFKFTDRLSLGAGLRFSRNDQTFTQNTSGILIPPGVFPSGSRENVLDYMVSPQFKLGKDQLLYARIATGYQPGGPNVVLPGLPPSVDSSTVTSYEVGLKTELLDHRILFNISGYHIDWSDIQITKTVNGNSGLVNGGEATSDGVEIIAAFEPVKGLRFGVNGAYTDATLSNDAESLEGRAGDRLPFVPRLSWSATADYYVPLGNWTIRAYVKNVTDKRAYQQIFTITDLNGNAVFLQGVPIQPRTFGVEIDFKF